MKAPATLRKLASRIHGRRKTYPIGSQPATRTVLRYDPWFKRYEMQRMATLGYDFSPANTREVQ